TKLTEAGMMVGTPYYISPEQCRGEPLDPRADIYSLGIILYELLAGNVPFRGRTLSAVIIQHATEPPPLIRRVRPDISETVEAVVLRALAKDRNNRPATAREMGQELEQALAGVTLSERVDIILEPIASLAIGTHPGLNKFATSPRTGAHSSARKSGLLNYDSLTGLHSHAYFIRNLEETLLRCSQLGESLGVVIFGVDKFKHVNNTYGYLLGDLLLREIGHLLCQNLPEQMILCRAPGDGFTTMAVTKQPELVAQLANKLINLISQSRFLTKELPDGLEITLSAGIAFYPDDGIEATDLFELSKHSLTTAKTLGAGQVARKGSSGQLSPLANQTERLIQFESFVGRNAELEKLKRGFEQSVAGRGRFVLITGDAGLGKTRLVEEFRRQLAGKDVLFLQSRFYESGGAIPYKAFCDSLRGSLHYLMEYNPEDTKIVFGSMADKVINDFSSNDPLSLLLGNEPNYSANAEQEKYRIFDYLVRIYLNLSKLRPVILFLDDLHWADELTL
ncbi:MAG: diguanylate cyclase domain-containing protein, partial [bacterium]